MTAAEQIDQAVEAHNSGNLADAERVYRQVLRDEPDNTDAMHLLALLENQKGNTPIAVELLKQAIGINPQADLFHINLASIYASAGQHEAAISEYKLATELNSNAPAMVFAQMAGSLAATGKLEESAHALQWAVQREPSAQWYLMLAEVLHRLNRIDEATEAVGQSLKIRDDLPEAYGVLGLLMDSQNKLSEAEGCFRKAIELRPNLAAAHQNLGRVLNRAGRWHEAVVVLQRAISLDPNLPQAHNNLGDALRTVGRADEALAHYRLATEMYPNFVEAWANQGDLLLSRRKLKEAVEALNRAIAIRATPGMYVRLGQALAGLDQFDESLEAMGLACECNPTTSEAYTALGSILYWLGRVDEAMVAYRGATIINPDASRSAPTASSTTPSEIRATTNSGTSAVPSNPSACPLNRRSPPKTTPPMSVNRCV